MSPAEVHTLELPTRKQRTGLNLSLLLLVLLIRRPLYRQGCRTLGATFAEPIPVAFWLSRAWPPLCVMRITVEASAED